MGLHDKWPKKNETRAKKKRSRKQWKNKRFQARGAGQKKTKLQKTYGFLKTFKMLGKMKVSGLQSRQRARAIHGGFKPTMRNCTWIPPKTLEFLMFPGGPRRGNDVNPGLPFVIAGKTYGFLESLKILGKSMVPSLQSRQRAAATQGGSRSVMQKMRWDPTQIPWDSLCLLVVPGIW